MNAVHINKTRPAARTRGPLRGYALRALPWALAAAFLVHLVLERGLHLYKAATAATYVLEACLAAAVLIWVWRALRRMEDLPAGNGALAPNDEAQSSFMHWFEDDDLMPGYPVVDRTGSVPVDRPTIY